MSCDGRGGGHHGTDQMSAPAFTLATFEVPIGCAGAPFPRRQNVCVHPDAHTASRITPLEAGIPEDLIQSFLLSLSFDYPGTGNHERLFDPGTDPLSLKDTRRQPQVLNAGIRARPDEHSIERYISNPCARLKAHIFECLD